MASIARATGVMLAICLMLSCRAVARPFLSLNRLQQNRAVSYFKKHGRALQANVPLIESLELRLTRSGDVPLRPCRGIDAVTTITELHIARTAGIRMSDVTTTKMLCGHWGVHLLLSFVTYPGQVLGVNAAYVGQSKLAQILADPLEEQFNLTLAGLTVTMVDDPAAVSGSGASEPTDGSAAPEGTLAREIELLER